ncbi:aminoglycoside phosphotransferase family protein [Paraflavisolibacter sp. H34]|uniref:phosphotransferase enzyme family protein n=1 Tax=Huijunlia imazamoxiresistens TaxID=3127457 RepID=UPI00301A5F88
MSTAVLSAYGFKAAETEAVPFGSGLINHTWKLRHAGADYILQRVNQNVFPYPDHIADNIRAVAGYLERHHPGYLFPAPLRTPDGRDLVQVEDEGYFRLFAFVPGAQARTVVEGPEPAFEAAAQFGQFTRLLSGFDVRRLQPTLPHFHDLSLRFRQLVTAVENSDGERLAESRDEISYLVSLSALVRQFERLRTHNAFRLRVTHHDTKISNVLFDAAGKGLCVVDLDTVMPGYFFSDVGDMMRTYLSPVSEEEQDFDRIEVRDEVYQAIIAGYCSHMKDELAPEEKAHLFFSGKFMVFMQALRFLTDHLNKDSYYGARYPGHNLVRARNQVTLLRRLIEKERPLSAFRG